MGLEVSTPAASPPVTQAEAKNQCRVTADDDDDLIDLLIDAATAEAQALTGRQFVNATFDWTLDSWRDPRTGLTTVLRPPRSPLSSVSHIKYYDVVGNQQTWDSGNYEVDTATAPGRIVPAATASWPSLDDRIDAIEIRFVAGYSADEASVPANARAAILLMVQDMYENRSRQVDMALRENLAVRRLLRPLQVEFA